MMRKLLLLTVVFAHLGCDVDEDHDNAEGDLTAEVCEHMADGPNVTVEATLESSDSAPLANKAHHRIDLTLPESMDGSYLGVVRFEADEAGEYLFFLSQADEFRVHTTDGRAIDLEASESVDACAEVAIQHTVDLDVGTYYLTVVAAQADVGLVHEHAGGDHDHEEHDDHDHEE